MLYEVITGPSVQSPWCPRPGTPKFIVPSPSSETRSPLLPSWTALRPVTYSISDAIGIATAEVGVMLGAIVLVTGPLWGNVAWGTYWTWELV